MTKARTSWPHLRHSTKTFRTDADDRPESLHSEAVPFPPAAGLCALVLSPHLTSPRLTSAHIDAAAAVDVPFRARVPSAPASSPRPYPLDPAAADQASAPRDSTAQHSTAQHSNHDDAQPLLQPSHAGLPRPDAVSSALRRREGCLADERHDRS